MKLAAANLGEIQGLPEGYQGAGAAGAPATFERIATNVVGFLTLAGGFSFIIYTILAGLTWITAREEAERLSKAKQMFTNAIIGLAILVSSWAISGIFGKLFGFEILNPAQYLEKISPGAGEGGGSSGGGASRQYCGGLAQGQCGPGPGGVTYCCVAPGTLCNGNTFSYPFNCPKNQVEK